MAHKMGAGHGCHGAVTASISAISFDQPVHIGDVLRVASKVVFTGRTSMVIKVHIEKYAEGHPPGIVCNTAHLTFVAMDESRKPTPVPSLKVESEADQKEWNIAKTVSEQAFKLKSISE